MRKLWMYGKRDVLTGYTRRWDDAPPAEPAAGGSPDAGTPPATPPTPPPATPPSPATPPPDWRSGLPVEIKDHPCLSSFKDPLEAAKAYVNVQKLIGVDKIPMPPKDAKPEVREKFLNDIADRLGRPKEAKDYQITQVKLPDGSSIPVEPQEIDAFKAEAHKLGLLPHQVDGIYRFHIANLGARIKQFGEAQETSKAAAEERLRQDFGAAYEAKIHGASALLKRFAGADFEAIANDFGRRPDVIRFLANVAGAVSEDALHRTDVEGVMTPKEAQSELAKVTDNLMKMQKSHPEYKDLVKRRTELYQMAYPG